MSLPILHESSSLAVLKNRQPLQDPPPVFPPDDQLVKEAKSEWDHRPLLRTEARGRTAEEIKSWLSANYTKMDLPAAYLGDEPNTWLKDWNDPKLDFKLLLCGAMSYAASEGNLAIPLIYSEVNHQRPNYITERCFFWNSRGEFNLFKENNIPIFGLESKNPAHKYDVIAFSVSYIMPFIHIPLMLNQSGIPVYANERAEEDPIIIVGGCMSPVSEVIAGGNGGICDIHFLGESEDGFSELLDRIRKYRKEGLKREEILFRCTVEQHGVYVPKFYDTLYDPGSHEIVKRVKLREGVPDTVKKAYQKSMNTGFRLTDPFMSYKGGMSMGNYEIARGCSSACTFCQEAHCLVASTVISSESGLVRLGDLGSHGDHVVDQPISLMVTSDEADRRKSKADLFHSLGVKKTIKLLFERDLEIEGTLEHPLKVLDEQGVYRKKRMDEITDKDAVAVVLGGHANASLPPYSITGFKYVKQNNAAKALAKSPLFMDVKLAELTGYLIGDGYLESDSANQVGSRVVFCVADNTPDVGLWIEQCVGELFSEKPSVSPSSGCHTYRVNHRGVVSFFEHLGLERGAYSKKIPVSILQGSEAAVQGFLRGLFEADGGITGQAVALTSVAHQRVLREAQLLLLELGILSSIHKSDGNAWQLYIGAGRDVKEFYEQIGFISARKKAELQSIVREAPERGRWDQVIPNVSKLFKEVYERAPKGSSYRMKPFYDIANGKYEPTKGTVAEFLQVFRDQGDLDVYKTLQDLLDRDLVWVRVKNREYGEAEVFDLTVPDSHLFVANGMVSGNTYRPYRERSVDVAIKDMKELMIETGAVDVLPAAFTSSDHRQINTLIKRMLEEVSQDVAIISQRADAFGSDEAFAKLTSMGGSRTVSIGMEGVSQRIRDALNKAVSEMELLKSIEFAIRNDYTSVKLFMITNIPGTVDDDYEELIAFLNKLKLIREKYHSKCEVKLSFTPLFISAHCLTSNTRVWTDQGIISLGDLSDRYPEEKGYSDHELGVVLPQGQMGRSLRFFKNGMSPVRRVVTTLGFENSGTLNHPLRTWDGKEESWTRLQDLKVGDRLVLRKGGYSGGTNKLNEYQHRFVKGPSNRFDIPANLSEDWARFMGYLIGDGFIEFSTGRLGIQASTHEPLVDAAVKELMNRLFGSKVKLDVLKATDKYELLRIVDVNQYRVSSVQLKGWLNAQGIPAVPAHQKKVPDVIWTATPEVQGSFIRGLFTSDAHVACNKTHQDSIQFHVEYTTVSEELAKGVQQLLLANGVVARLSSRFPKEETKNRRWTLDVRNADLLRYQEWAGFDGEKAQKLDQGFGLGYGWKSSRNEEDLGEGKFAVSINVIEDVGEQETFDIEVAEEHAFIANGMVSHNTPYQWNAATVNERTLTPWIRKIKALGFGFRLGSGARFDESYVSQLMHLGDRRLTRVIVQAAVGDEFLHYGSTPKGTVQKWEAYMKPDSVGFEFFFQQKHQHWKFSWDHFDMLIAKESLWSQYQRAMQAIGQVAPCIEECYQCKACDSSVWKERKHWDKDRLEDRLVDVDKVRPIRQSGDAQRVRVKLEFDEAHRYVEKDHWKYQVRRALYKESVPLDKHTVKFASDAIKMFNWISGRDYVDVKLIDHVWDKSVILNALNKHMKGARATEARIYNDVKQLRSVLDLCLYEMDVGNQLDLSTLTARIAPFLNAPLIEEPIPNDLPGRDGKVPRAVKSAFLKKYPYAIRIKRMGFRGVERVIVDLRSYVDDCWLVNKSNGIFFQIKLRGELTPYDAFAGIFKTKWKQGFSYPAARLDFLLEQDDEQDSFLVDRCEVCDNNIEQDLFGNAIHDKFCLKHLNLQQNVAPCPVSLPMQRRS